MKHPFKQTSDQRYKIGQWISESKKDLMDITDINKPPSVKIDGQIITDPEYFRAAWEASLDDMSADKCKKLLRETSPHHPNPNMVWLYNRLLMQIIWLDCELNEYDVEN